MGVPARGKRRPVQSRWVIKVVAISHAIEVGGGAQTLGRRGGLVAGVILSRLLVGAGVVGSAVEAEGQGVNLAPMKSLSKTWYSVTANYKAVHLDKPRRRNLWEQTIFLVMAATEEEAQQVGYDVAKSKEHQYLSVSGGQVLWQLIEVVDVKEIIDQELKQGMEVGWRFFEKVDKAPTKSGD